MAPRTDHNGYRFQCFITGKTDSDLAALEARHWAYARDRVPRPMAKAATTHWPD